MPTSKKSITFDGTAGSGKGTIAKAIAKHYNYAYLDTGKLYRAVALIIKTHKFQASFLNHLVEIHDKISEQYLNSKHLYDEEISSLASKIASKQEIRDMLFKFQESFMNENKKGFVLDGRDTGSVICKDADIKFYVDADSNIRAQRRFEQNESYYINNNITVEEIKNSIIDRDNNDKNRKTAPLIIPENAHIIDNSNLPLPIIIKQVLSLIDT